MRSTTPSGRSVTDRGLRKVSRPGTSPRGRNNTLYAVAPPVVNIRTHDMLTPYERRFLEAAERGDKPTLTHFLLQADPPLNVNCMDAMGRTAIEIAVDNENIEIVELLLKVPNIRIGNALLCAIREGVYRLVELLINHHSMTGDSDVLGEGWTKTLDPAEAASAEYSSDISPVILAAHLNQFEILQMLLHRGATIQKPHHLSCTCGHCEKERSCDSLHHSLKRINTYRALASPAWMSLTSNDPILSAFKLSWELQKLAFKEHEFKDTYMQLSEQCKTFACDLLSQCRSTEEVIAVLNKENNSESEVADVWASKLSLSRLKLAIKYEQKQFVSHPHCQQLLTSIWYEGFPGRQQRGSYINFVVCFLLVMLWPALALCYIIVPKSRIGRIVRSPFMKFLYYSISFGCFLILLTLATFEPYRDMKGERKGGLNTRASDRGPPPTVIESLVAIWAIGMLWSEVKQLWEEGFKKYTYQWWNWLDFLMICFYLCTLTLRALAYYIFAVRENDEHVYRFVVRTQWHAYEPMLVAEGLFAMANVFSFARIIYLFQTNPYLGPLQISLGCMLVDVLKFCFIFILIISSFSIGLAQLYWYYDPHTPVCLAPDQCVDSENAFSSIASSYVTLLWSLFSITKTEDTDTVEPHYFTSWVGRGMFIMYHMTSIIVLLNMLIAMMSHSFQIINDHADLEWKFHRTKLWMAHFDEGSSLPPPFNIIISPKSVYFFFRGIYRLIAWMCGKYQYGSIRAKRATIRCFTGLTQPAGTESSAVSHMKRLFQRPGYSRHRAIQNDKPSEDRTSTNTKEPLTYKDIMQRLIARYIHRTKKDMKMDGVNEDDLLEIKQDISSLRYELRDDRMKEIKRASSHIDAVKRDIMRTMSTTTRALLPRGSQARLSLADVPDDGEFIDEISDIDVASPTDHNPTPFSTAAPVAAFRTNGSGSSYSLSHQQHATTQQQGTVNQHRLVQATDSNPPWTSSSQGGRDRTATQSAINQPPSYAAVRGRRLSSDPRDHYQCCNKQAVEELRSELNCRFDELLGQMKAANQQQQHTTPPPIAPLLPPLHKLSTVQDDEADNASVFHHPSSFDLPQMHQSPSNHSAKKVDFE